MKISRTALAGPLAVALAIPAFALGQPETIPPSENAKPPATAYGVMCDRLGTPRSNENDPQPGTPFSRCVSAHRKGVGGQQSDREAARAACREAFSPSKEGRKFGECVASTRNLILGLRGLKAQS
jgi:hypothetical protein